MENDVKKLLIKIYECLVVFLHPAFWEQLYEDYPYSKSYDKWCRDSLEQGCEFKDYNEHTIVFNGRTLWVYTDKMCCFMLWKKDKPKVQPSRYTKILMWKKFESYKRNKQLAELENWK